MWLYLESRMGYEVPTSLKYVLWKSGYDSVISLKQLSEIAIEELEEFIEKNKNDLLQNNYLDNYVFANQQFAFVPGHKNILLNLPVRIQEIQSQNSLVNTSTQDNANESSNAYSVILNELINTAKRNHNKSKHAFQYDDTIKYFATYIFLLCGRTCYETLNKNLPIPSTKTVCKYPYMCIYVYTFIRQLNVLELLHEIIIA